MRPLSATVVYDSAPVLKQFDYRPRQWRLVALFLLALAGAGLLTYFAIFLDRPLNVRGFQLRPNQARLLFAVIAALSPIGLFCLGSMVYVAFAWNRRVAVTEFHVILPRPTRMGLSRDEVQIPLNSISLVSIHAFIGTTKLLRITHAAGVVSIPSNMFRSRDEFDHLCRAVRESVENARRERAAVT